jgi:hypothetical protein
MFKPGQAKRLQENLVPNIIRAIAILCGILMCLITFGLSYVTDYKQIEIIESQDKGRDHEYRVVSGY